VKNENEAVLASQLNSDVTRVGVTLFFLEKTDDLFTHRPVQSDDLFLAVVSSQLPPFYVVCPLSSSVLSKFGHIFLFHSGVTPSTGAVPPAQ